MAKAKPKKAAKAKPKPKPKPKAKPKAALGPPVTGGGPPPFIPGMPLIVRSLDDSSNPVESWVAIAWPAGFPADPTTAVTGVTDSTGVLFSFTDTFNFTGTTILNVGFFSNSSTAGLGNTGMLQITLTNPPVGLANPVNIPAAYIDDDDLP